jgi:hypothetical protein
VEQFPVEVVNALDTDAIVQGLLIRSETDSITGTLDFSLTVFGRQLFQVGVTFKYFNFVPICRDFVLCHES